MMEATQGTPREAQIFLDELAQRAAPFSRTARRGTMNRAVIVVTALPAKIDETVHSSEISVEGGEVSGR